jgi:hypothetical protein
VQSSRAQAAHTVPERVSRACGAHGARTGHYLVNFLVDLGREHGHSVVLRHQHRLILNCGREWEATGSKSLFSFILCKKFVFLYPKVVSPWSGFLRFF